MPRRDRSNRARSARRSREERVARQERSRALQHARAREHECTHAAARCVVDKALENWRDPRMDARGFRPREQPRMRRDVGRGDGGDARAGDHGSNLALARVRESVCERHDDRIAAGGGEFARRACDLARACRRARRSVGERTFTQRARRMGDACARPRNPREEFITRLVADVDHALERVRHDHADLRAAAFEERIRAARGREAQFDWRERVSERCSSEHMQAEPRRVDRALTLHESHGRARGDRNRRGRLDRVATLLRHGHIRRAA